MNIIAVCSLNHIILWAAVWACQKSDCCIRLHLEKWVISHFISPNFALCSLYRSISTLCNANVVLPFVLDTNLKRKVPVHSNLTTGTHSPRGLVSQAICLLSASQEPEVVSGRFHLHILLTTFISPSVSSSPFHHLLSGNKVEIPLPYIFLLCLL